MSKRTIVTWDELSGKEARGVSKDVDLGEVQSIGTNYIVTQKGTISKDKFFIPKYLVDGFDGDTLWFHINEGEKESFKRDMPPAYEEYVKYKRDTLDPEIERQVRIIEKRP